MNKGMHVFGRMPDGEDKDLADIFVKVKSHGHGGKRKSEPMYRQFATTLSRNGPRL